MPSHLHWILKLDEKDNDIVKVLRTMKSYTATQLLKRISGEIQAGALPVHSLFIGNANVTVDSPAVQLEYFSKLAYNETDQLHRFWQRNSDVKPIESYQFLGQKLNYVHNNPVREKWALVELPCDYPYSSCRYYEKGVDWNDLRIQSLF